MDWKRKINEVVKRIEETGYKVHFVDFCEDNETPGFLGFYGGVADHKRKKVKVRTKYLTRRKIYHILLHELDHILNPDQDKVKDYPELGLNCGGNCKSIL